MQEYKIVIKHPPITTTNAPNLTPNSNMVVVNNYLVNQLEFKEELTNENTVREFLNDYKNEELSKKFFTFLQNSTANKEDEYKAILYDNKKLSSVLNEYYVETILSGFTPTTTEIKSQVLNTETVEYKNTNFSGNGETVERINTKISELVDINKKGGIYLEVMLKMNYRQIAPIKASEFAVDKTENGILYKQGFVDLNKKYLSI